MTDERKQRNGYVDVWNPTHPLAPLWGSRAGWVARHRMTLYDALGGAIQNCWYCGWGPMPWKMLDGTYETVICVDHWNERKGDDRLWNLVPSCWWCNLFKSRWPATFRVHMHWIKHYTEHDVHPQNRLHPLTLCAAWFQKPVDEMEKQLRLYGHWNNHLRQPGCEAPVEEWAYDPNEEACRYLAEGAIWDDCS